ncbi:RecQ family ATP-dependent DNA helicase [Moheibacter sediminis]|uniref:ATP-dependent DNA helicase RecQ n=1 Tax=Moheibacter sediminis TaxID=1434700 RepID=A0A1W2C3D9_9FLAO|nr:ATP-dependent DNA helicase RecQ [Moheibacter sediminis]SMC79616.1 ATP-dependent DNA helicase RecQ [Moheibacter sediminis]
MLKVNEILNKYWHYPDFIYPQKEIIESVLNKKDTLAILPTGGGKSLCYQIPAMANEGITLVISPLIALMQDQIQNLESRGIKAVSINSTLNQDEIALILAKCKLGDVKLLYIAPERLQSRTFIQAIQDLKIELIAVDEAHCISQWGHDFRPAYMKINQLRTLFPKATILALTATAPPKIKQEIISSLNLKDASVFEHSLKRENLTYTIVKSPDLLDALVYELQKNPGAAIIFARTREQTYKISQYLVEKGFDAEFFHAKLSLEEKNKKQKDWMQSDSQIMVSTNAFGMGIDKSNVRNVIHLDLPSSIEAYVQEAGRAGRDGKPAACTLFLQNNAIEKTENIFKSGLPNREEFSYISRMLYNHFEIGENERPEHQYNLDLIKFIKKFKLNKKRTLKTLEFLEQKEVLFINKFSTYSTARINSNPNQQQQSKKSRYRILEYLVRNHPGILSQEKSISEFLIALQLNKSVKKVRKILHQLNEEGFLDYNDRSIKKIIFIRPRETNYLQNNLWYEFERIQVLQWKRLQEMIYYTVQKGICREKLLLRYFGEKTAQNCGRCDVCKSENVELDSDLILIFLGETPKTLQEILAYFITSPKESVLVTLQELMDEELIETAGLDSYIKK